MSTYTTASPKSSKIHWMTYICCCVYVLLSKCAALEQQGAAVREKLERRVTELEKKLTEQENSGDTAAEVKHHT